MITIRGIELDIDFTDADVQDAYNTAAEKLQKNSKFDGMSAVEITRKASANVREFIDAIYGEGIGSKVLPKDSARDTMITVDQIVSEAQAQFDEVSDLGDKFVKIGGNRTQRRSSKK